MSPPRELIYHGHRKTYHRLVTTDDIQILISVMRCDQITDNHGSKLDKFTEMFNK
jgi:hypothetical protein